MRNLLFFAIATITLLSGCANNHYQDLPHPTITQEQDTPFIFKERYQTIDTELTSVRVEHQSDFVTIESTDEYVFWFPSKSTQVSSEQLNANEKNSDSVINEHSDTTRGLMALEDIILPNHRINQPVTSNPLATSQCKPILCDGSVCGDIAVCGDKPCDVSLHGKYACSSNSCEMIAANPTDVAKGEAECGEFAQLDICPIETACKRQGILTRGRNNES